MSDMFVVMYPYESMVMMVIFIGDG